jgi:K+-transporting ATPase KdpF subunit
LSSPPRTRISAANFVNQFIMENIVISVIACAALAYLVVAVLRPEKF